VQAIRLSARVAATEDEGMSTTRPGGVLAFAVAVLVLLALLPASASAQSVRFGAWTPNDPFDGNTNAASTLESQTGRRVEIVSWYQNWGGGDWISTVQNHVVGAVTGGGRTPMLTWEPWAPGGGTDQPRYRLSRIADGSFDAYMSTFAAALKATGSPIYLRPMHEFNGDWYPWGGTVNANSPALFVRAWRHMVDVFRTAGADNVRFVWSPNNVDVPASNRLESYYPGDAYVDVLAVDGYNWGAGKPEFGGWQSFTKVFMPAYDRLRAVGPQPIWIAEVGTAADGGDKAAWIRDMFARARNMDRLDAIVWFNENKERDWRAAPTPEIAAAFAPATTSTAATPGAPKAASRVAPKLSLTLTGLARAGRRASVRWRASHAGSVMRWNAYLNGRRVRSATRNAPRIASRRIARPGRYRWKVIGRDARGRAVVSAGRSFRVTR
jgi:beta-mannanase